MKQYKEVTWKGKKIKLPFPDPRDNESELYEMEEKHNRFTGQSTTMPSFAAGVYEVILGQEYAATIDDKRLGTGGSKKWDDVRKGLGWFRRYFAEQYMVVLD